MELSEDCYLMPSPRWNWWCSSFGLWRGVIL